MAVFLFVMACVALLTGLMGLVAGYVPRMTTGKKEPQLLLRGASRAPLQGLAVNDTLAGRPGVR